MKKYYIRKSRIQGEGVFAAKDLKRGETIFILKGRERHIIQKTTKQANENQDMVGIGKDLWIDPLVPASHINHSCNPNVGIRGRLLFVAMKNIKKDEELCFDYSISEEEVRWKLDDACTCGARQCRKSIRSIQSLPERVYRRYLPFIPHYFQRAYLKSRNLPRL